MLSRACSQQRGDHPGLVHIISAMEACDAYKPWHDKQTHKTFIRPDSGKCLHYYFYFQDAKFGLVYLRVPTWAPFRLQFYCNGHSWLARKLTAKGIGYTMADNAFVRIDDWARAQQLADTLSPDQLHRTLDRYAALCCPVSEVFGQSYHWSLMQVEYATDLAFRSTATLGPLYEQLVRQSVLSVKAEQVATFLGRQITPLLAQEIGSQFSTRIDQAVDRFLDRREFPARGGGERMHDDATARQADLLRLEEIAADLGRRAELSREVEDIAHRRGAERINRLRVVADHGQSGPGLQGQEDRGLEPVRVLVFVDQHVIEPRADIRREHRIADGLRPVEQQIVVVEHVLGLLGCGIRPEEFSQLRGPAAAPGKIIAQYCVERHLGVHDARVDAKAGALGGKPAFQL